MSKPKALQMSFWAPTNGVMNLGRLDLRIVPAPVREWAIGPVVDGIAGNVENLLLELDESIFELDLVHRTILGPFCVLFHAAKIRYGDAIGIENRYSYVSLILDWLS